ncbi:MAG: response regulator [Alphaproteobacteria bacterium]
MQYETLTRAMTCNAHILVVDDHAEIRDLVSNHLAKEGFRVSTAPDGTQMRRVLKQHRIDLVVLDLMLPGEDGLTICRQLRASSQLPILMLTAKSEEFDRVLGLEMGADDYLAKPFGTRELVARIKAILRRANSLPPERRAAEKSSWRFDRWTLDLAARNLKSDQQVVKPLSTAEFELLVAFAERPHVVLTRDQLLDLTRGRSEAFIDRSIDTRISRLRRKIEADPRNPEIIKTVWGGGYVFAVNVACQ